MSLLAATQSLGSGAVPYYNPQDRVVFSKHSVCIPPNPYAPADERIKRLVEATSTCSAYPSYLDNPNLPMLDKARICVGLAMNELNPSDFPEGLLSSEKSEEEAAKWHADQFSRQKSPSTKTYLSDGENHTIEITDSPYLPSSETFRALCDDTESSSQIRQDRTDEVLELYPKMNTDLHDKINTISACREEIQRLEIERLIKFTGTIAVALAGVAGAAFFRLETANPILQKVITVGQEVITAGAVTVMIGALLEGLRTPNCLPCE